MRNHTRFNWLQIRSKAINGFFLLWLACLPGQFVYAEEEPRNSSPDSCYQPHFATPSTIAHKSILLDAVLADTRIIAVGERGHIVYSDDNGVNWIQAKVPTQRLLTALYFHDAKHGWAVGHDSYILHTQDGGETWSIQFCAPNEEQPLFDIWFADAKHGIAIGAYGGYYETTDGGSKWSQRFIADDDFHLYQIIQTSNTSLMMVGEAGQLYRSNDLGKTWQLPITPYTGSLFGILQLGKSKFLVFGLRGNMFSSNDNATTWSKVAPVSQASIMSGTLLDDKRIVLVGLQGTILVSNTNEPVFSLIQRQNYKAISKILPIHNQQILLFGVFGVDTLKLP